MMIVNEEELLKVLNKEKSYTEEDIKAINNRVNTTSE